jgi:hypothetical protein
VETANRPRDNSPGRFNRAVFTIGQPQSAMPCTFMAMQMPRSSERIPVEEAVQMQKFAPLSVDHPLVNDATGTNCPGCNQRFRAMDVITRVAIGPGDNEEARRLCREGSFYEAVGIPVHWACATGEV